MLRNSMPANDDQWLAVSVKQGNQQSFGLLYDKYAPALAGIISRIVHDKELAEKVLNTVFVKVWNQIAAFNSANSSLFTWLINIARQTAFEESKWEPVKNLPDHNYVYEENKNNLSNKVSNKPSAFDLVYYKGRTYAQAATELHLTTAEVIDNIRMTIKSGEEKEIVC